MDGKLWLCKYGHVLGRVKRVPVEGDEGTRRFVTRLAVFRVTHANEEIVKSRPAEYPPMVSVEVEGTAEIHCGICGCTRTWYIGEAAIEALIAARTAAQVT